MLLQMAQSHLFPHWSSREIVWASVSLNMNDSLPHFYINRALFTLCSASRTFALWPTGRGGLWSFSPWQWSTHSRKWVWKQSHSLVWLWASSRAILQWVQRGKSKLRSRLRNRAALAEGGQQVQIASGIYQESDCRGREHHIPSFVHAGTFMKKTASLTLHQAQWYIQAESHTKL